MLVRYFWLLLFIHSSVYGQDTSVGSFFWTKFTIGSVIMFITYQLLTVPERRRQRESLKMLQSLSVGDTVLTTAGIVGEIESSSGKFVTLKFPSGYSIVILKESVMSVISQEQFKKEQKA